MNEDSINNTETTEEISEQTTNYASHASTNPQPVKAVNLVPLGAWLSLLMLGTLGLLGYGYYNLNQKITSLESNLSTIQGSVITTPSATVDAIVAWQDGMQAQQAQEQARAQRQQQGLGVEDDIANIRAGEALSTSINSEHATIGVPEAKVVLMEFSDINCPFCGRYQAETLPRIIENYVDTGKIRYVYRNYIGVGGQVTADASSAARCLREDVDDSIYLSFVQAIYGLEGRKNIDDVTALASEFGAGAGFNDCVTEQRYAQDVQDDTTTGQRLGIRGTPGFIIGFAQEDGTIDGINVQGALPYEVFERYIEGFLADAEAASVDTNQIQASNN